MFSFHLVKEYMMDKMTTYIGEGNNDLEINGATNFRTFIGQKYSVHFLVIGFH